MKKAASISKILPPTLQTPIALSSISKIELRHPKHRSGFPSTRAFIKRYIPPMRYYNPSFLYKAVEVDGVLTSLVLYDGKDQEVKQLELKFTQTPEELLAMVQKIDKEVQEKAQNTPEGTAQAKKD